MDSAECTTQRLPRIDWVRHRRQVQFKFCTCEDVSFLEHHMDEDWDQMSDEIEQVAEPLTSAADMLLPHVQPRQKTRWRDDNAVCVHRTVLLGGLGKTGWLPHRRPTLWREKQVTSTGEKESVFLCCTGRQITHTEVRENINVCYWIQMQISDTTAIKVNVDADREGGC